MFRLGVQISNFSDFFYETHPKWRHLVNSIERITYTSNYFDFIRANISKKCSQKNIHAHDPAKDIEYKKEKLCNNMKYTNSNSVSVETRFQYKKTEN